MGSSCFARGNRRNLKTIEDYIERNNIDCTLSGRTCAGKCRSGPIVSIDGEIFEQLDPDTLIHLLDAKLGEKTQ
jgi:NADH:ubiquinone oxidoreductase subunit E